MNSTQTCTRRCGGNVRPYTFVKADTVAYSVLQAGSNGDSIFGVSDKGTWLPPLQIGSTQYLDDGYAGTTASPPITVFLGGSECLIRASAAIAVGAYLAATTNGLAVTSTSITDNVGAIALEAASGADVLIKCRVLPTGIQHNTP